MGFRILTIGDIVGRPGREVVQEKLPAFIEEHEVDFVLANGENAAQGSGLIPRHAQELLGCGVDVLTTGDHIWKRAKIVEYLRDGAPVLRPENYPPSAAGRGHAVFASRRGHPVGVINLIGRVYMGPADCPFRGADAALAALPGAPRLILVDMHAEATSEKTALGWHLDGRVTAVVGTHTHVPTADERILPGGTAYITDLGMTGPHKSVIGRRVDKVLYRFTTGMYSFFDVATEDVRLCGALIDADPDTGKALSIQRITLHGDR